MGEAIHRKLGNEEALTKYGRSSFIFVGGTGLVQEHVPERNKDQVSLGRAGSSALPGMFLYVGQLGGLKPYGKVGHSGSGFSREL